MSNGKPFHFPGSAPRPQPQERRVSFDSSADRSGNTSSNSSSNKAAAWKAENPLLVRSPAAANANLPSTPRHPSPFAGGGVGGGSGGGLRLQTPATATPALRQRRSGAFKDDPLQHQPTPQQHQQQTSTTTPLQESNRKSSPLPPPPRASLSTGAGWVPSALDDQFGGSNKKSPSAAAAAASASQRTTPSANFLSPYSYSNLPSADASATINKHSNCWVLAFGYHSDAQRDELLRRFFGYDGTSSSATILQVRRCGPNATALLYSSELHAAKAACQTQMTLRDGTVCGAQQMSSHDPRLAPTERMFASRDDKPQLSISATAATNSNATTTLADPTAASPVLTEADILRRPRRRRGGAALPPHMQQQQQQPQPRRSICEQLLRWLLAVPDHY